MDPDEIEKYKEMHASGTPVCNFVVGCHAGSDTMAGSYNIVLGDHVGNNLTTESHRLIIGTIVNKELTHEQWEKLHDALKFALQEEMPLKIDFSGKGRDD